jgi:site-specific recombinase XerD
LKVYLPSLQQEAEKKSKENGRKYDNPYLFPSNGTHPISDEWVNRLLKDLAAKAGIALGDREMHFHLFRKLFLSSAIDSKAGFTAGKILCGKAVSKSDSTYLHLTTHQLREKFILIKGFLTIEEQSKVETETIELFKGTLKKIEKELEDQQLETKTVRGENIDLKERISTLEGKLSKLEAENAGITASLAPFRKLPPDLLKKLIDTSPVE